MKTKIAIIVLAAIVVLSFTFAPKTNKIVSDVSSEKVSENTNAPIGGFEAEEAR